MDSAKSLLSRGSASRQSLRPYSPAHELPRWRTPSPMSASIIPPPIVQSTYSMASAIPAQSIIIEKSAPSADRQSELEADLQFLLDAQADGLTRGYSGRLSDEQDSTGSTTPTVTSTSRFSSQRPARSTRKKPGLRSARRGIHNRILTLSTIKGEELEEIDDDVHEKDDTLERIKQWEEKRAGLQRASSSAKLNDDSVRVQRLQQEADTLQEEINHVELQLADMKSRHRKIQTQISAIENAVEANTASYDTSLRLLEEEIRQFLTIKPPEVISRGPVSGSKTSMWQLPPKRRTLEMARQYWTSERDTSLEQRHGVEMEKSALDEAAPIWKDICTKVNDFERHLRAEMTKLSEKPPNNDTTAWEEQCPPQDNGIAGLRAVLGQLNPLIETVESHFTLAQERSWTLLVAAIGAELDALTKGRTMLDDMLHETERQQDGLIDDSETTGEEDNGRKSPVLDHSFETARRRPSDSRVADANDDPDPELLFSQHDESEPE